MSETRLSTSGPRRAWPQQFARRLHRRPTHIAARHPTSDASTASDARPLVLVLARDFAKKLNKPAKTPAITRVDPIKRRPSHPRQNDTPLLGPDNRITKTA
jgi:hypothetical protein